MTREEREKLVHIGMLDEKRKMDAHCLIEASRWLDSAMYIDNVISDQTVTFTDEERLHLKKSAHILREKRYELRDFSESHYEEMMDAISGGDDE